MMIHYDLFAGIGGFSFALDQVFYDQKIKHIFCEWEPFPTAVLKKHWPDATYYGDIADLIKDIEAGIIGKNLFQPTCQNQTQKNHTALNALKTGEKSDAQIIRGGANSALRRRQELAYTEIKKGTKNTSNELENTPFDYGNQSSMPMAESADVVEKKKQSFWQSTTLTGEEQKTEEQKIIKDSPFIEKLETQDSQKNTKSCATTVITQNIDSEYVHTKNNITILSAGVPCQPASVAGRRKGKDDDRWLWPQTFRAIELLRPDWVLLENVRGLLTLEQGVVFKELLTSLEDLHYETREYIIPAVSVGAPHRRDRVWIVAHRDVLGNGAGLGRIQEANGEVPERDDNAEPCDTNQHNAPNAGQQLREQGSGEGVEADTTIGATRTEANQREREYTWADDWREVATATCNDREHDGLSYWLDCITREEINHAIPEERITRQKVLELWRVIQSQCVWDSFRGRYEIQEAEVLYEALRQFSEEPETLEQRASEQGAGFEADIVRGLWNQEQPTRSSRRRQFVQQYEREHQNTVRDLPQEASLAVMEAWHILRVIRQALIPREVDMDGVTISATRHRKERLKACGNAIVPQVAVEIFKAIRQSL